MSFAGATTELLDALALTLSIPTSSSSSENTSVAALLLALELLPSLLSAPLRLETLELLETCLEVPDVLADPLAATFCLISSCRSVESGVGSLELADGDFAGVDTPKIMEEMRELIEALAEVFSSAASSSSSELLAA